MSPIPMEATDITTSTTVREQPNRLIHTTVTSNKEEVDAKNAINDSRVAAYHDAIRTYNEKTSQHMDQVFDNLHANHNAQQAQLDAIAQIEQQVASNPRVMLSAERQRQLREKYANRLTNPGSTGSAGLI